MVEIIFLDASRGVISVLHEISKTARKKKERKIDFIFSILISAKILFYPLPAYLLRNVLEQAMEITIPEISH
jgi:hypothetical protein